MHQINNPPAAISPDREPPPVVSREEYGCAYQRWFQLTVRFLGSKGLSSDIANEIAQSAWTRGWERRCQLRDSAYLLTWVNSIALNAYRGLLRHEQRFQALPEISVAPRLNLAALDTTRILDGCRPMERMILRQHHLEDRPIQEIADECGCTETAMRIRLLRARRSVKSRLRPPSHPPREDRLANQGCEAA
jgi:RNA polymerase sigma factor (sigma-70 family)